MSKIEWGIPTDCSSNTYSEEKQTIKLLRFEIPPHRQQLVTTAFAKMFSIQVSNVYVPQTKYHKLSLSSTRTHTEKRQKRLLLLLLF